jgi:hypothetical protein
MTVGINSKLQLKPDTTIALIDAPEHLEAAIVGTRTQVAEAHALLVFVRDAAALEARTKQLVDAARREALTWVAYPKGGQLSTDLNRDVVRETLEPQGAHTVRQVALDDIWSALRVRAGRVGGD